MTLRTLAILGLLAGPRLAAAQDCGSYALFKTGTTLTQASLDPKGKLVSTTTSHTTASTPVDGGLRATIHAESIDPQGKSPSAMDYTVTCVGGTIAIDMRAFMSDSTMAAFKDADVKIEANQIDFPAQLAAGQQLPEGTMKMTMTMKGATPGMPGSGGTIDLRLYNRTVVGPEKVTVPAGTYDAWKIAYDSKTTITTIAPFKMEMHVTEWFVPGIGAVRSETTSAQGRPFGSSQLTAITP